MLHRHLGCVSSPEHRSRSLCIGGSSQRRQGAIREPQTSRPFAFPGCAGRGLLAGAPVVLPLADASVLLGNSAITSLASAPRPLAWQGPESVESSGVYGPVEGCTGQARSNGDRVVALYERARVHSRFLTGMTHRSTTLLSSRSSAALPSALPARHHVGRRLGASEGCATRVRPSHPLPRPSQALPNQRPCKSPLLTMPRDPSLPVMQHRQQEIPICRHFKPSGRLESPTPSLP